MPKALSPPQRRLLLHACETGGYLLTDPIQVRNPVSTATALVRRGFLAGDGEGYLVTPRGLAYYRWYERKRDVG